MPCLIASKHNAGAVEGAPNTLGYPSPEVTALGHTQQPSAPLYMHQDDVWAVAVMGLLWLSKGQDMPFGPTRQQAKRLTNPQGLADAKKWVLAQHDAWVSRCPDLKLCLSIALYLVLPLFPGSPPASWNDCLQGHSIDTFSNILHAPVVDGVIGTDRQQ